MKERPILFSGEMVKAIFDGKKTQTRRIVKFPKHVIETPGAVHEDGGGNWVAWTPGNQRGLAEFTKKTYPNGEGFPCPYGKPGDRLWVRETWLYSDNYRPEGVFSPAQLHYRVSATTADLEWLNSDGFKWKSPRFMPRWASRLTLEITKIRVERLNQITNEDAMAEGIKDCDAPCAAVFHFAELWDKINGERAPWDSNPFVWVIEFKRVNNETAAPSSQQDAA